MRVYEIAVAAPLRRTLTYGHPEAMEGEPDIAPGRRVLVPLGRRKVTGYILGTCDEQDLTGGYAIKPIAELLDPVPLFPENLIPFFRWVAEYYHYPIGEVIRTALPGGLTAGSGRKITLTSGGKEKLSRSVSLPENVDTEWFDRLLEKGELSISAVAALWRKPPVRRVLEKWEKQGLLTVEEKVARKPLKEKLEVLITLNPEIAVQISSSLQEKQGDLPDHLGILLPELKKSEIKTLAILLNLLDASGDDSVLQPAVTRQYSSGGKALRSLAEKKIVSRRKQRVYRNPFDRQPLLFPKPEKLTDEQQVVLEQLYGAISQSGFQPFLLHGVTGCGKTEVYLRAAEKVIEKGQGVLVLVPEIALASMLEGHFYCRFGDKLALLHSGLSPAERHDQWQRIASGEAMIVIGARSAVFAPLANPGLVIIDEEHEPAYKQEDTLRYNGRDLGVLRAHFADCPVILGSATPSVVSYQHAQSGKYTLLTMKRRVHDQCMPVVEVVDLGGDRPSRPDLFFSDQLITALWENMERRQQSLLFVNRRGFASFSMCKDCGHIVECRNCQVSLTLHRHLQRLICHYCGFSLPVKIICPSCGSHKVEGLGLGSERIEEEVRQLIPHARVARLDSDTASSRKHFVKTLREVHQGDVDILVGTQMIAKGLHFPNMTLVGVVWADSGLGMPDFKASERTFQLLAQVTGRAGRGEHPGRVIIQTYQPHHYAVQCARQHDYTGFFNQEIDLRRDLLYPPFSRMVNVRISASRESDVKDCGEKLRSFLLREIGSRGWQDIDILGPAPAPLARIKNKIRWQLMLKSGQLARLHELCESILASSSKFCPAGTILTLDVDPENMM